MIVFLLYYQIYINYNYNNSLNKPKWFVSRCKKVFKVLTTIKKIVNTVINKHRKEILNLRCFYYFFRKYIQNYNILDPVFINSFKSYKKCNITATTTTATSINSSNFFSFSSFSRKRNDPFSSTAESSIYCNECRIFSEPIENCDQCSLKKIDKLLNKIRKK